MIQIRKKITNLKIKFIILGRLEYKTSLFPLSNKSGQ